MGEPAGRERGHHRTGRKRRVEQTHPGRAGVVDGQRERREERARHPERHRQDVDHKAPHQLALAPRKPKPRADRLQHRLGLGDLGRRLRPQQRRREEHGHERRGVERVGEGQADLGDDDPRQRRADHHAHLVEAIGERDRRLQAGQPDHVRHHRRAGRPVKRRARRRDRRDHVQQPNRWRPSRGQKRERGGRTQQQQLGEHQKLSAVVTVGQRTRQQGGRHEREQLDQADQADLKRRAGDDVDLVGQRHQRDLAAQARHERPERQQPKVARLRERTGVDHDPRKEAHARTVDVCGTGSSSQRAPERIAARPGRPRSLHPRLPPRTAWQPMGRPYAAKVGVGLETHTRAVRRCYGTGIMCRPKRFRGRSSAARRSSRRTTPSATGQTPS